MADARYFGFENFGNTCYCNATLQLLFHSAAFRRKIRRYADSDELSTSCLCTQLAALFDDICRSKQRTGVASPSEFLKRLTKTNEQFRLGVQQDAHEFLNFLLNNISDRSKVLDKALGIESQNKKSFVQDLFEGVLTNETRCLSCETVTSKDECFLDLSVDVSQNSSITHCFEKFSAVERLCGNDKFFCDACNTLQEAQKTLHVRRAPPLLVVHLKRFKYVEQFNCHTKLLYRVAFPFQFRLRETAEGGTGSVFYSLLGVVVHRGGGPNSGHYVSFVRSETNWLLFNDDKIELVDAATVTNCFGLPVEGDGGSVSTAYILFYEKIQHKNLPPSTTDQQPQLSQQQQQPTTLN